MPKQFYLLGEDVSTAREIEVPSSIDEDELRQLIASHFAIVGAKGMHSNATIRQWVINTDHRRQALGL